MPGREGALISVPYYSISQFHTLCQWMIGVVRVRLASPLLNLTWLEVWSEVKVKLLALLRVTVVTIMLDFIATKFCYT